MKIAIPYFNLFIQNILWSAQESWHVACEKMTALSDRMKSRSEANRSKSIIMKTFKSLVVAALATVALMATPAFAADPGKGQNPDPQKPTHPEKPAKPALPDDIKKLIEQFHAEQQAKVQEFKKLAHQMSEATAAEREQLREQMRQLLADQKQEREKLREQIRERLQELAKNLPSRKDLIDAAKEKAKGQHGKGD